MRSVIIGMYRQGNKNEVIASELGLNIIDVKIVIKKYFSTHT